MKSKTILLRNTDRTSKLIQMLDSDDATKTLECKEPIKSSSISQVETACGSQKEYIKPTAAVRVMVKNATNLANSPKKQLKSNELDASYSKRRDMTLSGKRESPNHKRKRHLLQMKSATRNTFISGAIHKSLFSP